MKFTGPPSPFVTPEENRYKKGERSDIESVLKNEFGNDHMLNQHIENFFSVPGNQLTADEKRKFAIFAVHTGKRVLNAESQKVGGIRKRLERAYVARTSYDAFPLLTHDIGHATSRIINKREDNIITPIFLTYKEGFNFNNQQLFEDELYGGMWGQVPYGKNEQEISENVALHYIETAPDKESFIRLCIEDNMTRTLAGAQGLIAEEAERIKEDPVVTQKKYKTAEDMIKRIEANPPAKIVEMLTYIWDHKENPRVLADLFFQELGPYIEQLQKREIYKPETK